MKFTALCRKNTILYGLFKCYVTWWRVQAVVTAMQRVDGITRSVAEGKYVEFNTALMMFASEHPDWTVLLVHASDDVTKLQSTSFNGNNAVWFHNCLIMRNMTVVHHVYHCWVSLLEHYSDTEPFIQFLLLSEVALLAVLTCADSGLLRMPFWSLIPGV